MKHLLLLPVMLFAFAGAPAQQRQQEMPQQPPSKVFTEVSLDQKLGAQVPLDLTFKDEQGQTVALQSYMKGKPVVLSLVYYECPMICTEVLNGMVRSFKQLPMTLGQDYEAVTVSINPREKPPLAASKKQSYIAMYGHPEAAASWHWLTGEEANIKRLADTVGFRYVYDEQTKQYAHPTGIMVLTPKGQVARYLYGVEYPPKDLKFALVEASNNTIGSPVDKVLLLCYKYDPLTGKYGLIVMNLIRIAAIITLVVVGGVVLMFLRRDRRKKREAEVAGAGR